MRALRRIRTGDDKIDRLEDALQEYVRQFDNAPWLDGVQVDTLLSAGNNVINHKLGRKPRGWWLIRRIAAAAANYPSEPTETATNKTLTLNAAGNEAVSIWIW